MRIDELRQTLSELADDGTTGPLEHGSRLRGVDEKVVATRRRRTAAAGGGIVAAIVVAALASPLLTPDTERSDPTPPTQSDQDGRPDDGSIVDTDLPTVTDHGVVFYADAGGSTLVDEAVSAPGDTSLLMTVTPDTTDLTLGVECWRVTEPTAKPPHFEAEINGRFITGGSCDSDPYGPLTGGIANGNNASDNEAGWEALGVSAGAPSEITVQLKGPGAADRGEVRLVVGLYTAPERAEVGGVWYPTKVVHDGVEYQSTAANSGRFTDQRHYLVSAELPPSEVPYFVLGGAGAVTGHGVVRVNDSAYLAADQGGVSAGNVFQAADSPAVVRFHSREKRSGVLFLVVYQRVE